MGKNLVNYLYELKNIEKNHENFVNNKKVHRKTDSTKGHGSFVPNSSASGSGNVFANG